MTSLSLHRCGVVGPARALQWMDALFFQERQAGKVRRKAFTVCKRTAGVHRTITTEEVVTSQRRTYA